MSQAVTDKIVKNQRRDPGTERRRYDSRRNEAHQLDQRTDKTAMVADENRKKHH